MNYRSPQEVRAAQKVSKQFHYGSNEYPISYSKEHKSWTNSKYDRKGQSSRQGNQTETFDYSHILSPINHRVERKVKNGVEMQNCFPITAKLLNLTRNY